MKQLTAAVAPCSAEIPQARGPGSQAHPESHCTNSVPAPACSHRHGLRTRDPKSSSRTHDTALDVTVRKVIALLNELRGEARFRHDLQVPRIPGARRRAAHHITYAGQSRPPPRNCSRTRPTSTRAPVGRRPSIESGSADPEPGSPASVLLPAIPWAASALGGPRTPRTDIRPVLEVGSRARVRGSAAPRGVFSWRARPSSSKKRQEDARWFRNP